jgi:hypothetical protein
LTQTNKTRKRFEGFGLQDQVLPDYQKGGKRHARTESEMLADKQISASTLSLVYEFGRISYDQRAGRSLEGKSQDDQKQNVFRGL